MDTLKVACAALVLCMSSAAYAQQAGKAPANSGAQTKETQPGQAGQAIDAPAAQGTPNNSPGTLMDKRANALSPNGASSSARTGTVKQ
ncbi:hypothetical protein B0G69_7086 [Paraburkholderia sp. RAU2J]|uniref:hypothetical protein n=1 Tax=Paraburkholderia sp. RAU2J TaxID=1938810 RepID=UPI000EB04070|nr:hypothetical protein [Paraburkholderia sp. RAU2J]RKT13876.1 hypothetical protein B0G69_7086 [Paraburkholderia sp. RAU2J]